MPLEAIIALLLPFAGTSIGAACVFAMNRPAHRELNRGMSGFAAGVMVAASVWSLIIPSIERSASYGVWRFLPALVGLWTGFFFLILLDRWTCRLESASDFDTANSLSMTVLAVTLHNLPEGMAVGVVIANWLADSGSVTTAAMLTLSLGIALQNLPEGAIISMPLSSGGIRKPESFLWGLLSGVVEPIGAVLTMILSAILVPLLPYLLSFSAGAMLYVVVAELIPGLSKENHSYTGPLSFGLGFSLMMTLDVMLG